ncbi:MAG: 2-keto-4-pentenoate hydratase [Steroidobacteraceae bacterium]
MLTDEECRSCVEGLLDAARTGRPIGSLGQTFPGLTIADAYRIQRSWLEALCAGGVRAVGYKVGLTSTATQALFGAAEPMYGRILAQGVLASGSRIRAAAFPRPRIEVELAFILGADLAGADVSRAQALEATERIVPAFEIVAQRTDASRVLGDAIADNGAHGAVVLGSGGIAPGDVDVAAISATLYRNREPIESGAASSVMGHPAEAVAWLARTLARAGERLERGQIILTGTLTPAIAIVPGNSYRAEYSGPGTGAGAGALGALEVTFG